jgi:ribosomal protein L11 methyltransferase (prmA)
LEKGAIVIFSGILNEKEEALLKKAKNYNLKQIDRKDKNNWVSLVFKYES